MKHIAMFISALVLGASTLLSQNVEIPDTAFLNALIEEGVDTNHDGLISVTEAEDVINLDVSPIGVGCHPDKKGNIKNLEGINAFINLVSLDCSCNNITSVNVTSNTALKELHCQNNLDIRQLDLDSNTSLVILECWYNGLTNLDVSNNIYLESLECGGNYFTQLDISNNKLLQTLTIGTSKITNLNLSNNDSLQYLVLDGAPLQGLDITHNIKLEYVYYPGMPFEHLDVSHNTSLNTLYCYNSQLIELDISNSKINRLRCENSNLTRLNVSNCTSLMQLNCSGNQLTTLDISSNTRLFINDCYPGGWYLCPYLNLSGMRSLQHVCVPELPFNFHGTLDTAGCPNIIFTTECSSFTQNDFKFKEELSISPNPSKNYITIRAEQPSSYTIKILSTNGQEVFKTLMSDQEMEIDLSSLKAGMYIISIQSKDFIKTQKIIKI